MKNFREMLEKRDSEGVRAFIEKASLRELAEAAKTTAEHPENRANSPLIGTRVWENILFSSMDKLEQKGKTKPEDINAVLRITGLAIKTRGACIRKKAVLTHEDLILRLMQDEKTRNGLTPGHLIEIAKQEKMITPKMDALDVMEKAGKLVRLTPVLIPAFAIQKTLDKIAELKTEKG